ncbi:hypothetical protein KEM56_005384, partial [Ascosphaera pollenicola]
NPEAFAELLLKASPASFDDLDNPLDPDGPTADVHAAVHLDPAPDPAPAWANDEDWSTEPQVSLNAVGRGLLLFKAVFGSEPQTDGQALVDCGASQNFVDESLADRIKLIRLSPTLQPVQLPNALSITSSAIAELSIRLGPLQYTVEALVVPRLGYDVILGLPWLSAAKPQFDWDRGDLHLPDKRGQT